MGRKIVLVSLHTRLPSLARETITVCLASIAIALSPLARADDASLSKDAAARYEAGLRATQTADWPTAIRYFSEAQTLAPFAPPVLFNLGLAYARSARELAAIAWLNAYLAVSPSAQNAAVKAEIARLTAEAKNKRDQIFKTAMAAADKTGQPYAKEDIALAQAYSGDIQGATETLKLAGNVYHRTNLWSAYVSGLLASCDNLDLAASTASGLQDQGERDAAWASISSWAYPFCRDPERSVKAAEQIQESSQREKALNAARAGSIRTRVQDKINAGKADMDSLREVASVEYGHWVLIAAVRAQVGSGRLDDVQRTMALLSGKERAAALSLIGQAQARRGATVDPAIVAEIRTMVANAVASNDFSTAAELAHIQLKLKDTAGVNATARQLLSMAYDGERYEDALAQAILGDYQRARSLARAAVNNPFNPANKEARYGDIAFVQAIRDERSELDLTVEEVNSQLATYDEYERRRLAGLPPVQYRLGILETQIADALLARGRRQEAIELLIDTAQKLKGLVPSGEGLLTDAIADEVASGNTRQALQHAARAFQVSVISSGLVREIARVIKSEDRTAVRDFSEAAQYAIASNTGRLNEVDVIDTLHAISALDLAVGDRAASAVVLRHVKPIRWIVLARSAANDTSVNETAKALQRAASVDYENKPVDSALIPRQLADVGKAYGAFLHRFQAIADKSGNRLEKAKR